MPFCLTFRDFKLRELFCVENKKPLTICYKYNKPIHSTIFNFNKFVNEHVIEINNMNLRTLNIAINLLVL